MSQFYHDHETLEEFVRALARATVYHSWGTGYVISEYWKTEAEEWVKELDAAEEQTVVAHTQVDGPKCKQCGAFTTYARVNTHGLCMKCEQEQNR